MRGPIPSENLEDYVETSRTLDIPVAAGESEFTRYDFRDLITKRAVDNNPARRLQEQGLK
ncbi:MAG: enolase C-terminal domain-like protein [Candidatus Bathyarchaeia archaeon]